MDEDVHIREQFLLLEQEKKKKLQELHDRLRDELNEKRKKYSSLVLEIGCGHGHFLNAYAQQYTNTLCIGIDIIKKRLEKCERKKHIAGINNVLFFRHEAVEFLSHFPKNYTIDEIFVLFPDPWPKNRHAKNRLFQPEFLDIAKTQQIKTIYLRTDSKNYIQWTQFQLNKRADDWTYTDAFIWPFEHTTFFQQIHPTFFSLKIDNKKYTHAS